MNAPARLALLLPWLNREETDGDSIRRAITAFVQSFDGSEDAGYVTTASADFGALRERRRVPAPVSENELRELGTKLLATLEIGFAGTPTGSVSGFFPMTAAPSVRWVIRGRGRQKPRWSDTAAGNRVIDAAALRAYRAAGAYVMHVEGSVPDLLEFLVAHVLLQAHMVQVHQCPARGCDKFFVQATGRRGAPQKSCSKACRIRLYADTIEQRKHKKRRR
jgi:hypothetical protein